MQLAAYAQSPGVHAIFRDDQFWTDNTSVDNGKPAGILIGFGSEEDWFAYRLENDPRFAKRMKTVKQSLRASTGLKMKDLKS